MRKMMTKEVTKTTVKIAKMETQDGMPVAVQLPDEIMMGNVSVEKAQKALTKKLGENVTVFEVKADTEVYEMAVEEFIQLATIKSPVQQEDETDTEEQE